MIATHRLMSAADEVKKYAEGEGHRATHWATFKGTVLVRYAPNPAGSLAPYWCAPTSFVAGLDGRTSRQCFAELEDAVAFLERNN